MGIDNLSMNKIIDTDVLIIGGGAAALRSAIAAYDTGARTIVVLKGKRGQSGATVSPDSPGVAWQLADSCSGDQDNPEFHFHNIVDVGLGMADSGLARILAYEVVERSDELERWGLKFAPDPDGKKAHYTGYSCFGDQPRAHGILNSGYGHAGDVVRVLVKQLLCRDVIIHENVFISDLLVGNGKCIGAIGLDPDGEIVAYRSGSVVLVAGGARQIYPPEPGLTQIDTTGDGYTMALRAGAELTNMEFTQYMLHPIHPFPVNVPGVFWALLPKLKNNLGEDALAPYIPSSVSFDQVMYERTYHYPFSCRDNSKWLDIAFANEIREGRGTTERGLFLDFSEVNLNSFKPSRPQHIPENYHRKVELPNGLVQVRPAAHAINGGLRINNQAESTLPGLFAAGEVATGPHGADRLGGAMVSGSQVFGARAGRYAAKYALNTGLRPLSKETLVQPLSRLRSYNQGDRDASYVLKSLQEVTGTHLIVLRSEKGLEALIARIQGLIEDWLPQVRVQSVYTLRKAIEVENSLITAELMARAAHIRQESRGSHFREDYPKQDDKNWGVNIIFRIENGKLQHYKDSLNQEIAQFTS
jgi:fumarate reductase (CoM/CoB) subunit A